MTLGEFVSGLIGDRGQIALAGAAGGMVRWLTLKSRMGDGIIAIIVGTISAVYLGPLAEPAVDALLGGVIANETARASFSGFVIGLGGITITGWVMDFWAAKRRKAKEDDGNGPKDP